MKKKKKLYSALGLILICGIIFGRSQIVSFHDKEFERVVRDYMMSSRVSITAKRQKPIRGPIFRKNINAVADIVVDLNEYKIEDMKDLGHFKNLKELHLAYVPEDPQADVIPKGDMPRNLDVICKLNYLDTINIYRMNINNSFKTVQTSVKNLCIYDCAVTDDDFLEKFPEIDRLVICDSTISSFAFLDKTEKMSFLFLENNVYSCSLDQLKAANNIEELELISDEENVFGQLPYIPTVKKLYLQGEGAPKRAEAEEYLNWENLEKLYINGENYEVKSGIWSKN